MSYDENIFNQDIRELYNNTYYDEYQDYKSFINDINAKHSKAFSADKSLLKDTGIKYDINDIGELKDGRFSVVNHDVEFECFFKKQKTDKLYVFLNGGRPSPNCILPTFNRWTYYKYINYSVLNIADPMYRKHDNLMRGWYYGSEEESYIDYLAEVIAAVAKNQGVDNKDIVIFGSSAGGFAALHCGCKLAGTTVVAICAQIDLSKYPRIKEFERDLSIDVTAEDKLNRNNLYENIKKSENTRFVFLANAHSEEDIVQLDGLCDVLDKKFKFGVNFLSDNMLCWLYEANGYNTHNAQDYAPLFWALNRILLSGFEKEYIENISIFLNELWRERFEVFSSLESARKKAKRKITSVNIDAGTKIREYREIEISELNIQAQDYVWNHKVILSNLRPNTTYSLTIGDSKLISGEATEFTVVIRDVSMNYVAFSKTFPIGKAANMMFTTAEEAEGMELRVYPGCLGSSQKISLLLKHVNLNYLDTCDGGKPALADKEFTAKINQVISGYNLAKTLCVEGDTTTYIVINRHIGDASRNLSIIKAYKKYYSGETEFHFQNENKPNINFRAFPKRRIVKKVIVLTTKTLSGVVKLCSDVDDIIVLDKVELQNIELYANSSICAHANLLPDEDSASNMLKYNLYETGTFAYRMNLPKKAVSENQGKLSVTDYVMKSVCDLMEEKGISPQKTVVLCPAAQSNTMLGSAFWSRIVDALVKIGYDVLTNVGPNEKALDNTKPLAVTIDMICGLGKAGCKIIGIQSGLLDLMVWMKANINIIDILPVCNERDRQFANNRNLRETITDAGSTTYIKMEMDDGLDYAGLVIDTFRKRFEET